MVKIIIVTVYSKFEVDISCSFKVMDPVHILANAKTQCKMGITYGNISSRVMGLIDNDLETDGKPIFQVSK
jgi:hypothetical protein